MLYQRVISELLQSGLLDPAHSVLVVCGGTADRDVLARAGFRQATISNVDKDYSRHMEPFAWAYQDAENLTYEANSFDLVIVNAGLHHCYSPHKALLEMLRVARRFVLVFEARDSLLLNVAKRIGLTTDYELEAVSANGYLSGGVANGPIPNHIYRWTEREILKVLRSAEPRYEPSVKFFYGLRLPHARFSQTNRPILRGALLALTPVLRLVARAWRKQGNEFGFLIEKKAALHPWLEPHEDDVRLSPTATERMGRAFRSPISKLSSAAKSDGKT